LHHPPHLPDPPCPLAPLAPQKPLSHLPDFATARCSEETLGWLAESCDEFLVHGVDVEGMQLGIDDELVQLLGAWSPIPVTYAGGARTLVSKARVGRDWGPVEAPCRAWLWAVAFPAWAEGSCWNVLRMVNIPC